MRLKERTNTSKDNWPRKMDNAIKSHLMKKLIDLDSLKRQLDDLARELDINGIENDKIYCGILVSRATILKLLEDEKRIS